MCVGAESACNELERLLKLLAMHRSTHRVHRHTQTYSIAVCLNYVYSGWHAYFTCVFVGRDLEYGDYMLYCTIDSVQSMQHC